MKYEKADIGFKPNARFLVKANNSIYFYTQHRFRCSLTVLTIRRKFYIPLSAQSPRSRVR